MTQIHKRIAVFELVEADASKVATLSAKCNPHAKPMLTQAQKKLRHLDVLKMLETVVSENMVDKKYKNRHY
tara:strand:+ start:200 stop:412 length:213 start_codon:yes stop_codon:yes gene_type:complete